MGVLVAGLLALGLLVLVKAVRETLVGDLADLMRLWQSQSWVKPHGKRIPVPIRVQIPRMGRAPPRETTGFVDPLRPTWPDDRK